MDLPSLDAGKQANGKVTDQRKVWYRITGNSSRPEKSDTGLRREVRPNKVCRFEC